MQFKVQKKKPRWLLAVLIVFIFVSAFLGWVTSTNQYSRFPSQISSKTQIVVFYQPGCIHCIEEFPTIKELSKKYSVSAINVLENKSIIENYNITATPTLLIINGKNKRMIVGEHRLDTIINTYSKLGNSSSVPLSNFRNNNGSSGTCSIDVSKNGSIVPGKCS